MKTPAEKCAERISRLVLNDHPKWLADTAAIIQSEYAPKSPDKCAEQAAERIGEIIKWNDKGKKELALIITESYAPTIQVAREAIYRECADYVLQLHLAQKPHVGAIDALKTAYDEFLRRAKQ